MLPEAQTSPARWIAIMGALVLAVTAFAFHLPKLAERPMHTDEAVHAAKLGILLDTGDYAYNPHEYHGPVIYYAALPFVKAAGAHTLADIKDETPLRLPIVAFGALLVLAVGLGGTRMGWPASLFAALLFAVSPAFSFYGRYYIQEVPFTLFCYIALACGWRLLETARASWAIAAGLALGVAIALKETWIIIMGTAGLTAVLLQLTSSQRPWPRPFRWHKFAGLMVLAGLISLATGLALLSNFFRNPAALMDAFTAMTGYVNRGVSGDSSTFAGHIHDHPWWYYLQLLAWPTVEGPWLWTEAGTLALGLVGIIAVIARWPVARGCWHFTVIFTILLTAFYSAIPYKTPWNVLPLFAGWTLLAGRGFAAVLEMSGRGWVKAALTLILLAWPGWLAMQTYRATIDRPGDYRNPYAYSPTSPNVRDLASRVQQIADVSPEGERLAVQIISPTNDYWPLPWYLRRFPRVGYFTDPEEANAQADVVITTGELDDASIEKLGPRQSQYYGLRPDVLMSVYVKQGLWDKFIEGQGM